jgi:hypothetical protein
MDSSLKYTKIYILEDLDRDLYIYKFSVMLVSVESTAGEPWIVNVHVASNK